MARPSRRGAIEGMDGMALFDVLLIAGACWLVFIVVTGIVNDVRRRIGDQRKLRDSEVR
jgi:uncharacterized membrane protein